MLFKKNKEINIGTIGQDHPNIKKIELGLFRIHTKGRLQFVETEAGDSNDIEKLIRNNTIENQKYIILPVITIIGNGNKDA